MSKLLTRVYRSPRHEGMYLYVASADELSRVPEALLEHFGQPQQAMVLALDAERRLAQVEAGEVLSSIEERGYYLQMTAAEAHEEMAAIAARNDKLNRIN